MIKLFRRIRQKLLSENRFSKYLIYAIGEIVLVVIGILIALQINNWNQERVFYKKELSYLHEIRGSLTKDTVFIHEVLSFNENKLKTVTGMFQIYIDTLTNDERIDLFHNYSEDFVHYQVFEPSNTAFNNMLNSESIALIKNNELRNLLSDYYESDYKGGVQERIIMSNRKIIDNYFPQFVTNSFVKDKLKLNSLLPTAEELVIHKNPNFLSELYGMTALINLQNFFLDEKLNELRVLIKKIDEQTD